MARTLSNTPAAVYQRERRERLARAAAAAAAVPAVDPRRVAAANIIATRYRERLASKYTRVPNRGVPTVNVRSFTGVTRAILELRPPGATNVQIVLNDRRVPGRRIIMRRFNLNEVGAALPANRYDTSLVTFNHLYTQVIIDSDGNVEESFRIGEEGGRTVRAGSYSYGLSFGGGAAADKTRETKKMINRIQTLSYKSKNDNCVLACMQGLFGQAFMCAKVGGKLSTPGTTRRVEPSKLFKTIREVYKLPKGPIAVTRARHIIEDLQLGPMPFFVDSELREIDGPRLLNYNEAEQYQASPGILLVNEGHCTHFQKITSLETCHVCQHRYVKVEGHKCDPAQARFKEMKLPNSKARARMVCWDGETRGIRNKYTSSYNLDAHGKVVGPPMLEYEQQMTCISYWGLEGDEDRVTMSKVLEIMDERVIVGTDCMEKFLEWLYAEAFAGRPMILKAHNGSRFDNFFVLQAIQANPKFAEHFKLKDLVSKGSKIVTFSWLGHEFQDSSLHLTGSLESVCNNYKAPIQKQKSTTGGDDPMDLCLRYEGLGPQEYLAKIAQSGELRDYKTYCLVDSVSLFQTMTAYEASMRVLLNRTLSPGTEVVSEKIKNTVTKLLRRPTAPGLVKGLNKKINAAGIKNGDYWSPDDKTFRFIQQCIIGGISHVGHAGRHAYGIISFDVCSEYPGTMKSHPGQEDFADKFEPRFPKGPCTETTTWVQGKLGLYKIENITVPLQADRDRLNIGCIPGRAADNRLNWSALDFPLAYVSNVDLETMTKNGYTFDVVEGVYWEESWMPFEALIKPFMDEKVRQDWLAKNDPANYNAALREACKLVLNSLYGALLDQGVNKCYDDVTDSIALYNDAAETEEAAALKLMLDTETPEMRAARLAANKKRPNRIVYNGRVLVKSLVESEHNNSIQYGCFVLAWSRLLVQGYLDRVGRHNVVVSETDSFYVPEGAVMTIKDSTHPVWRLGNDFGNLKLEHEGLLDMMALAKKCYSALKLAGARDIVPGKSLVHSLRDGSLERTVKVIENKGELVIVKCGKYDSEVCARDLYLHKCAFKGISKPCREDFVQLLNNGSVNKVSQNFSRTLIESNQTTGIRIGFCSKTVKQDSRLPYRLWTGCNARGPIASKMIRDAPGAPRAAIPRPVVEHVETEGHTYTEVTNVENARRLLALTRAELAVLLRKEFDADYEEKVARNGRAAADAKRENDERGKLSNVKNYCKAVIANDGRMVFKYGYAKIKGTSLRRENGRLYTIGREGLHVAMQGMPCMVRDFLLEDIESHDHDMKNAHPNIALGLAKEHGLSLPALEQYCADREGFLAKTGATKTYCLAMLNQVTPSYHRDPLVRQLSREFHMLQDTVYASPKYQHIYHAERQHAKGSYLNQELCVRENLILQQALNFIGHDHAYFLAYDGMMLDHEVDLDCLNQLTAHWGVRWDRKPKGTAIAQALRGQ